MLMEILRLEEIWINFINSKIEVLQCIGLCGYVCVLYPIDV